MALYYYRAFDQQGKEVSGYLDTGSMQSARDQLKQKKLYLISIESAKEKRSTSFFARFQRGVSLKDKIFFTKQLSVLLKAGIPLVQSLDLLSEQTSGKLQNITVSLRDNIKEGGSFAAGLSLYPKIFDNIYIQLVRAGEATGNLEFVLDKLTSYLIRSNELNKKIRSALIMPAIQLIAIIGVVVGLLWFVVPKIVSTFSKQQASLPKATVFLMSVSDFIINNIIIILIFVAALIVSYVVFSRTEYGSYLIDKIKLKLPLVGYLSRMGAVVQFCNTLGMLLAAGVNLSEALNIVVNIVKNKILTQKLEEAKEKIIKQGKISQYLKQTGLFPSVAIYLINTGEQSGELDNMLLSVAENYEAELMDYTDTLSQLLGPIMLLFMASIVGFIIMAIVMPMMQMGDILEQKGL